MAESRIEAPDPLYVPRDEAFEQGKQKMLDEGELKAKLHVLVPSLVATSEECHDFEGFHEVNSIYKASVQHKDGLGAHLLKKLPFVGKLQETEAHLKYDTPSIITSKWLRQNQWVVVYFYARPKVSDPFRRSVCRGPVCVAPRRRVRPPGPCGDQPVQHPEAPGKPIIASYADSSFLVFYCLVGLRISRPLSFLGALTDNGHPRTHRSLFLLINLCSRSRR